MYRSTAVRLDCILDLSALLADQFDILAAVDAEGDEEEWWSSKWKTHTPPPSRAARRLSGAVLAYFSAVGALGSVLTVINGHDCRAWRWCRWHETWLHHWLLEGRLLERWLLESHLVAVHWLLRLRVAVHFDVFNYIPWDSISNL